MPDTGSALVPPAAPARPATDKRAAILDAALRLIARTGLHDAPMAAVAREAGVAAGTLYLYFPGKGAMINALYRELLADRHRALAADAPPSGNARDALWESWHGLARWHLDRPEASSVLQQCEASGILTEETRDAARRLQVEALARFADAVARGLLRDLPTEIFYSLFAGPILVLAQIHAARELEVTAAVLRATFDGVCRSVLPADGAGAR